jgi:hypothetical protein
MLGWIEDIDWNGTNPSPLRDRVCNACFRWASRPRTQQEGLLFVTRRCECDVIEADHTKMWHDRGIRMFQAAARKAEEKGLSYRLEAHWHFLSTLLQVLGDLTTDQHTYKQINRVYRLLRRRSWPNTVAHLLPHGNENTMRGLLSWLSFCPDAEVVDQIHMILRCICLGSGSCVVSYVATSRTLLRHFITVFVEFREEMMHSSLSLKGEDSIAYHCCHLRDILESLFLQLIGYMNVVQGRTLLLDDQMDLFDATVRCWSACEHLELKCSNNASILTSLGESKQRLRAIEVHICMLFPEDHAGFHQDYNLVDWAKSADLTPLSVCMGYLQNPSCIYYHTLQTIKRLINREHCSAPGCRRMYANCGRLGFCSGCKILRYCSLGCQKTAWKHTSVPHKELCKALSFVFSKFRIGIRAKPPWQFSRPHELDSNVYTASASVIEHFNETTRWEMMNSEREWA